MKTRTFMLAGLSLCFLATFIMSSNTSALENTTKKAMSLGLYDCYVDGKFTNEVNIAERYFNPVNIVEASGVILLPNYNSTGVDDVNCRELLFGKNSWNGILGLSGNLRALSESERKNVVEKLQYTPKESSGSRKCFSMTVSWAMVDKDKRGSATSNEVCADVESDGNTMTTTFQTIGREFEQCPVGTPCIFANAIGNSLNIVMQVGSGDYGRFENTFNINQEKWDIAINDLKNTFNTLYGNESEKVNICVAIGADVGINDFDKKFDCYRYFEMDKAGNWIETSESTSNVNAANYELRDYGNQYVRRNIGGSAQRQFFGNNDTTLTHVEVVKLYQKYLNSYGGANISCNVFANASEASERGFDKDIKVVRDNEIKQCYIKYTEREFNGTRNMARWERVSVADIINWLNANVNTTNLSEEDLESISADADSSINESDVDTEDNSDTRSQPTCMNSGGAGSLGWILCPILDIISETVQNIYSDVVAPLLQVDTRLFSDNEDDGTLHAWGIFQTIANTAFIILFLFVIFSQLTGVGIDNYGIKKILPKLIIAAVLINLSYVICLICVDISNIVGNGIQSLFDGLSTGGSINSSYSDSISIGPTALTAVAIVAVLTGGAIAIWENPALIVSLLVSVLGVFIAILFLFVLLAGREAAIIVLMVISPLAFVCYILPNTKKFFDKWFKFWEGLLLVYPICGLLVGGGNFVSRLLLTINFAGDDFFMGIITMIVGIIPIFFIPTVLKGAFAAMGTIGSSIAGFGNRLRSGTTKRLRASEAYKNVQARGQEHRIRTKAGLNRDGNLTKLGERRARFAKSGVGKFLHSDRRQAAYINAAKKTIAEGESANAALTNALSRSEIAAISAASAASGSTKDPVVEYYEKLFEEAAKNGDINGMNSILSAATASGYIKDKDIAAMVRRNSSTIDTGFRGDPATRASWMRDIGTKYGNGFLGTDFELKQYMQSGGKGSLGTNYGDYVRGNISLDDIKPEDILKLSGDSLAGLAKEGIINKSIAQQVLAKNPNLSADKRIMLGAIANGNANVGTITTAEDFKNDAKTLMNNHSATTTTIINTDESMVDAWTAPTPDAVNIVQNFNGGGSQMRPVDVTWSVRGASSQSGNSQNTSNPTTTNVGASAPTNPPTNPNASTNNPTRTATESESNGHNDNADNNETFENGAGI